MDVKEANDEIRAALAQVQSSGRQFVSIPALVQFLSDLEKKVPESSEARKFQHESNMALFKAQHDSNLEMFRTVFDSSKTALTTSILVNGGATVALLALLGNLVGKVPPVIFDGKSALILSLILFAVGVFLGAIATAGTYFTQYCYSVGRKRSATGFHIATVVLVLLSYVMFASGVWAAYCAFIQ